MRVSSIQVRAVVEAAENAGVSASLLYEQAALSDEARSASYAWLDVGELDRLVEVAIELTKDPAFGLHWIERSSMVQFDLMPQLVANCPNLRSCFEAVLRFQPILAETPELELTERHDTVMLRCMPLARSELAVRVRAELFVTGVLRLLRYAGSPLSSVRAISFAHALPDYASEYTRLFGSLPKFGRAFTSVEFDRSELDRVQPNRNPELHEMLEIQTERIRSRVLDELTYRERVKREVRGALPRIQEMPAVARALGISERSLRRRLGDEGCTYSELVEATRIELARELLEVPQSAIKEIAHQLGFDSVSGFQRAFRRWTGTTPAGFRTSSRTRGQPPADKPT